MQLIENGEKIIEKCLVKMNDPWINPWCKHPCNPSTYLILDMDFFFLALKVPFYKNHH